MPAPAKSLLILDDEPSYLEMLGGLMAAHLSCPVLTFSRPLAALEAMPGLDLGVIATDYFMPQMNGLEFIRRARVIAPGVPFLIITGHGEMLASSDLSNFPEVRCVLNKPFRWPVLAHELLRHWPESDDLKVLRPS